MNPQRMHMVVSHWWAQAAILTFLVGFTVLGLTAYKIHTEHPRVCSDWGQSMGGWSGWAFGVAGPASAICPGSRCSETLLPETETPGGREACS